MEVGQYRAIAELGHGWMGRVLLGSARGGDLVAVKQVHGEFVQDNGFRARLRREVEAARMVSGAYTAVVLDADTEAAEPWLTSAFIYGPSLSDAVGALGGLPENSVLRLAAGLAEALVDVHRAGLVHRGVKPSNVLLAEDGPRLVDFGLARSSGSAHTSGLTSADGFARSAGFISPEQAQGLPSGPASDVFSLGTVLAMACTGVNPFAGPSAAHTLHNVLHADPDLSALPETVRHIVAACLAKDLTRRPSPAELMRAVGGGGPSLEPWPLPVYELMRYQHAEIVRLRAASQQGATIARPEPAITVSPPQYPTGPARTPVSASPRPQRWHMNAVGIVMTIAVTAAITAGATALALGHRDARTIESPPVPTVARSQLPGPDTGLTASAGPVPSPSADAFGQATPEAGPTPTDTDTGLRLRPSPSLQPAFVFRCAADETGHPDAAEPKTYLLACGDGAVWLQDLAWSDWGTPTAYATGLEMANDCTPDCADGTAIPYSASVTLTDLVDNQYTLMRIVAPGAAWTGDFTIDSQGLHPGRGARFTVGY